VNGITASGTGAVIIATIIYRTQGNGGMASATAMEERLQKMGLGIVGVGQIAEETMKLGWLLSWQPTGRLQRPVGERA